MYPVFGEVTDANQRLLSDPSVSMFCHHHEQENLRVSLLVPNLIKISLVCAVFSY